MSTKPKIDTRVKRLVHYFDDLQRGGIQVPAFQRDFVWGSQDKLDLFDSIKKNYPIGSILFWKPTEGDFGSGEYIGPFKTPKVRRGREVRYILDGYQRLSSLFGCLMDPSKVTELELNEKDWEKNYIVYYDLETEEFFFPRSLNTVEHYQVPLYQITNTREAYSFERKLREQNEFEEDVIQKWMGRYEQLGTVFIDYSLPSVEIIGGNIDEAVEIFSRVNSKGTEITPDWIVSALTYNKDESFRLGSLIDELLENLKAYNFGKLKRKHVFSSILHAFGKPYFDQDNIERLAKRDDFIPTTKSALEGIRKACKFLFEEVMVLNSKLLPYKAQLIFIADFFNQIEKPSTKQIEELKRWFWVTTYSNYFTIYSISKQRKAYHQFQAFIRGEEQNAIYNDKPKMAFDTLEFPTRILFSSVRSTALVLFLLNHSKGFKPIDVEEVDDLFINYLFKEARNADNYSKPEAVVPIIEYLDMPLELQRLKKKEDVHELLQQYKPSYKQKFLLSDKVKSLYENKGIDSAVAQRKKEIVQAERTFVEQLGQTELGEPLVRYLEE